MNSIKQASDRLSCFDRVVLFSGMPFPPHLSSDTTAFFVFESGLRKWMNNELKAGMGQGFKARGSSLLKRVAPDGSRVPGMTVGPIVSRWGLAGPQNREQGQRPD